MKTPVIDIHAHPWLFEEVCTTDEQEAFVIDMTGLYKSGSFPAEEHFIQMDYNGVDKCVLLPLDLTTTHGGSLGTNEQVHAIQNAYPDRFIGFASVDPFRDDACDVLELAFGTLKLSGLKLHPGKQRFYPSDETLEPIWQICEKYNKPVMFHAGMSVEPYTLSKYSHPMEFEELAYNHPNLRICLAHMAWPWVKEACMLMLKYGNVFADTACLYFDSAREFYDQVLTKDIPITWVDRGLRHQILFGTNDPRLESIRMKKALEELPLRPSTKELIMGGNALVFLGLEEYTRD